MRVKTTNSFFKVICIDENELEYAVLEDTNKGSIEDAFKFIKENVQKHIGCKWMIIPFVA